jgi:Uma2 family endonuclease
MQRSIKRRMDRPASWQDLEDVPEEYIGEIVNGELVLSPRPNAPHVFAASDLEGIVKGPFRFGIGGPGGWLIASEPRILFVEDIRVPDIAGWRKEHWTGAPATGPIVTVPDWICEVLSTSTESEDRAVKLPLYRRAGVSYCWLVSPRTRVLEVYRGEGVAWLQLGAFAGDVRFRAEPFDAVELDLAQVWANVPPTQESD